VLVYQRYFHGTCFHIVLNFSDMPQAVEVPIGNLVLSAHLDRDGLTPGDVALRANEGIIIEVGATPAAISGDQT